MGTVFLALILMQVKHFICDYPLQVPFMLGKFKKFPDFIVPLFWHSWVHGIGTLMICHAFGWPDWLIFLDLVTHFIIDRIKASPSLGGRWKPDNRYFWWALGGDQLAHHLVGIAIVWIGVS